MLMIVFTFYYHNYTTVPFHCLCLDFLFESISFNLSPGFPGMTFPSYYGHSDLTRGTTSVDGLQLELCFLLARVLGGTSDCTLFKLDTFFEVNKRKRKKERNCTWADCHFVHDHVGFSF